VHQIDLAVKESDWESMLENALSEEYISCTAVIDGEKFSNVGIRPKGNSSLNTVASSESDRYSFKLEFDHYDGSSTYHGLDKLCLNNAIQDNTYMKDFLCYQMMNFLGADAPLSSFVWITVNGEDWGLYTAVEAIEDAFAQRSYWKDHGQLYKPDSLDMGGGGRGAEAGERKEKVFSETEEPALSKAVDSEAANSEADHFRAMGGLGEKDGFGGPGGMGGLADGPGILQIAVVVGLLDVHAGGVRAQGGLEGFQVRAAVLLGDQLQLHAGAEAVGPHGLDHLWGRLSAVDGDQAQT